MANKKSEEKYGRIIIRVEKEEKFVERVLTKRMMAAMYDLQYMLCEGCWETTKLNYIDEDVSAVFDLLDHIYECSWPLYNYKLVGKRMVAVKKYNKDFSSYPPRWKKK